MSIRKSHSEETRKKIGLANKISVKKFYENGGIPWNKGGGKYSEETRLKMSIAQKKRFENSTSWNKGKKFSKESRKKMSEFQQNRDPEINKKISETLKAKGYSKGEKNFFFGKHIGIGEENVNWKGSKVGYRSLHTWVQRTMGKPCECSHCGKEGYGRKMHWANKSHEYKREISDWVRLCASCHKNYDCGNLILNNI